MELTDSITFLKQITATLEKVQPHLDYNFIPKV